MSVGELGSAGLFQHDCFADECSDLNRFGLFCFLIFGFGFGFGCFLGTDFSFSWGGSTTSDFVGPFFFQLLLFIAQHPLSFARLGFLVLSVQVQQECNQDDQEQRRTPH